MKTQIFKLTLTDKYCTSGSTVVVQLSVLCPKPSPIFFWESELTNSIHCWGKKKKNWTKVSKSLRFLHGMYSLSLDTLLFLLCCCGSWTIYFLLRLSALNVYQLYGITGWTNLLPHFGREEHEKNSENSPRTLVILPWRRLLFSAFCAIL